MSTTIKICFAVALLLALGLPATGQPARGKPAQKRSETEARDAQKRAASLFEDGQNAHQAGKLEEAVELYGQALKQDSSLWQAEFQRSLAYLSLNKIADAKAGVLRVNEQLSQFADSPELRQVSARAQIALGEIAAAESNAGEAERAFRKALELNPQAARAHAGLAEVFLLAGKREDAITEAKAAIGAGDDRASIYSLLAEALSLSGRRGEALEALNEVIKRNPKNAAAWRTRGEIHIARNDLEAGIADLRRAIAIDPSISNKLQLAATLARAKKYDEAVSLYQEVQKAEPENTEAKVALAALLIDSGKSGEAIAQLETMIKAEPNRADLRAKLGEFYLPAQPEKALEQYAVAAKLEPSQPNHQIGVGAALVKLRRYQDAVGVLRAVLAQNPKDDIAYFAHTNLATALFELDDFPNAAREFIWILDHLKDQKRTAITLYFLGICFDKLGDYEQALKAYQQFMSLASSENQLEIEKVKLRMPSLQRQIRDGKGRKKS